MNACAELFTAHLEAKNLNFQTAETRDGDSVVEFPYQGKVLRLFFSGEDGTYLSIYEVYERVPEDKTTDLVFLCNTLNCEYKWITFYLDKDNDIILHDDAILSVEHAADEAFELLIRMAKIADEIKPRVMRAIYA